MDREHIEAEYRLFSATSHHEYLLIPFGDYLAKREGYKSRDLVGLEAVHFYICHKFKWKPSDVKSMTLADLQFLLTEEMNGWTVPKERLPDALR